MQLVFFSVSRLLTKTLNRKLESIPGVRSLGVSLRTRERPVDPIFLGGVEISCMRVIDVKENKLLR
jgi:hypothetical protein